MTGAAELCPRVRARVEPRGAVAMPFSPGSDTRRSSTQTASFWRCPTRGGRPQHEVRVGIVRRSVCCTRRYVGRSRNR
jgi:hypothetical protein